MAENMKQGGMLKQPPPPVAPMSMDKDIRPLLEDIDAMLAEGEGKAPQGGMAPQGEMAPEGGEEAGGAQIVADMLDVSLEKAQQLLDAAMAMPNMAGKTPEQIAEMLTTDMNLRMQVEKNIGASEDGMARKKMVEGQMGPKSEPVPMEPTPAGSTK